MVVCFVLREVVRDTEFQSVVMLCVDPYQYLYVNGSTCYHAATARV